MICVDSQARNSVAIRTMMVKLLASPKVLFWSIMKSAMHDYCVVMFFV